MANDEKNEEVQEEEVQPVHHESHPRGKKITKMTLEELEAALKKVQETMGGLNSHHAQELVAKKEALLAMRGQSGSSRMAA